MASVTVLVLDTDEELNQELGRVEELLLSLGSEHDPDPDWSAPPAIVRGVSAAGVLNIALRQATSIRMLGPGGRYELVPLLRLTVDSEVISAVGDAINELGRGLLVGHSLISETLREWARAWTLSAEDLVARAAQAHAAVTVPPNLDSALLLARMPDFGDWTLNCEEVAAYDRYVRQVLDVWHTDNAGKGDVLDHWLHFGDR